MKLGAVALLRENVGGSCGQEDEKASQVNVPPNVNSSNNGDSVRLKRSVMIDSNKQRWLFILDKDRKYNNKMCLFYKISRLTDKKMKQLRYRDKHTYTRIGGLTLKEWNEQYKYFLFLCKKDEIREIHTTPDAEYQGSILLGDSTKGKLFIKGLHVRNYPTYEYDCKNSDDPITQIRERMKQENENETTLHYGYDTTQISTNRDS